MELRVLRYFRAVADEGSITDAAKALHVTQPTLSRQLAQLESELGRPLFNRNRNGIELTAAGVLLNRYAKSIIALADKAEEEVSMPANSVAGVVHIAAGETRAFSLIAQACKRVRDRYPGVSFELNDAPAADLMDGFVRGQYDILLDCDSGENSDFNQILLPIYDVWGVLMRVDDPLAKLDVIKPENLVERAIIASPQGTKRAFGRWAGDSLNRIAVGATYSLPLNGKYFVSEGLGIMLTYGGLVNEPHDSSGLCFRPLSPKLEAHHKVLWRKTIPTKQTQALLDELQGVCLGVSP